METGVEPARRATRRERRRGRLDARSKLRRRLTKTGIGIGVIVVVLVGGGVGYIYYRSSQITRIAVPVAPTRGPNENILLIGNTSRCAASAIAVYKEQCLKQGVTGVNSDVILVAHFDGTTGKVSLLSIPRDTFVPGARSGSTLCGTTSPLTPGTCADKIDSGLVQGPGQLIQSIENDFGIPINHFVDLNFATFTNVVNALGGLKMYFPDRLYDASSGLKITTTGCQLLSGTRALALVRSRHLYYFTKGEVPNYAAIDAVNTRTGPWLTPDSNGHYDGTGDLGRIVRVHLLLKALAQQVTSRGLGNPITDNGLIGAIAPNLTVDKGLSTGEMLHLLSAFRHAGLGSAPELTLPTITYGRSYYYYGAPYGDVIFSSAPQDEQLVDAFLGTSVPKIGPHSITVSVVDGTQSPTATTLVASGLTQLGYRVVPTSASQYVGPVSESIVLYSKYHLAQAERVLASLKGAAVLGRGQPAGGADVSVITGSDLAVSAAAPRAPQSTRTAAAGSLATPSSGTAGTPVANNGNFSYNAATTAIPSWDPRSCPAS